MAAARPSAGDLSLRFKITQCLEIRRQRQRYGLYSTELRSAGGEHDPWSLEHMVNSSVQSPSLVQRISLWRQ
ncbi:hypothetical protein EYF80_012428 [Liparis tanakae]|uniref:Uncharacterized protein n=1 Tax=Liparis tanakae TaxID=230148 RepID=A0A4Z2IIQ6_9TELE|nr:hypothetical protein EYF80_012428 [Liparis tanakae]